MPMVPGDDRPAALEQAGRFEHPRVRFYWDPERLAGRTWGARHVERLRPQLLALMPEGSEEREMVATWDPEQRPLWDAACFFEAGAGWPAGGLPVHAVWTKQFSYSAGEPGANGFFRGEGWQAEVAWSSWDEEFAKGMARISR
jgi:hypothetical protein